MYLHYSITWSCIIILPDKTLTNLVLPNLFLTFKNLLYLILTFCNWTKSVINNQPIN